MSVQAITWAYEQDAGGSMAQFLLVTLANSASEQGVTFLGRNGLAERCRCSPKCVTSNITKLEEAGLLARVMRRRGNGSRTSDWVVLAPLAADRGAMKDAPADDYPEEIVALACRGEPRSGERESPNDEGDRQVNERGGPEPLVEPSVKPSRSLAGARERWPEVASEMQDDAEEMLRSGAKVNGRVVTEREIQVAAAALSEFNRQMESDFGLGPQLTRVVMRVRERPSWDAAKHVRLVRSACRLRWWESSGRGGRATPQVIYGNDRVFEQVAQDASDEAAGKTPAPYTNGNGNGKLKHHTYGGLAWDELTPGAQAHIREAVAMGLEPWDGGADAADRVLVAPAGSNGRAGVTAENILDPD